MKLKRIIAGCAILLLVGCASPFGRSPDTRFYTLDVAGGAAAQQQQAGRLRLGVGPLELPDLLDRPQIVSRARDHQLRLAEFDHWAGSLNGQVLRVLVRDLAAALPALRVDAHPWGRHQQPDFQLQVTVLRFDGERGALSVLEGNWSLLDRRGGEELIWRRFRLQQEVAGNGMDALVASYAALLSALSAEMAALLGTVTAAGGTVAP